MLAAWWCWIYESISLRTFSLHCFGCICLYLLALARLTFLLEPLERNRIYVPKTTLRTHTAQWNNLYIYEWNSREAEGMLRQGHTFTQKQECDTHVETNRYLKWVRYPGDLGVWWARTVSLTCQRYHDFLWLQAVREVHFPPLQQPHCQPPWYWITAGAAWERERERERGREGENGSDGERIKKICTRVSTELEVRDETRWTGRMWE